jgi:Ca-activated chloride channel homolog
VLRNEDFKDDKKDAGEIGSGHSVTALYEIVPAGVDVDAPDVGPLKYQTRPVTRATDASELATINVRYKAPDGDTSRPITAVIRNRVQPMSGNLAFASAVAEFGMLLRESDHRGRASYQSAASRARAHRGSDPEGYRAEFVKLVDLAASLKSVAREVAEPSASP